MGPLLTNALSNGIANITHFQSLEVKDWAMVKKELQDACLWTKHFITSPENSIIMQSIVSPKFLLFSHISAKIDV